jgi:histidine ammonia-lyase
MSVLSEPRLGRAARITLDGALDRPRLEAIADGARVRLSELAHARIAASHDMLRQRLRDGLGVYGASSGVGDLRDVDVAESERDELQINIVRSHCCGIGSPLPARLVRAALALRAATFARGHSAVRPELVDHMVAVVNADIHPVVPSEGSVGASGDPVLLAHLALGILGEGTVELDDGTSGDAAEALARNRIEPIRLRGREGLALVNGLDFTISAATLLHACAERLVRWSDAIAALTLDALDAAPDPFSADVQRLRGTGRHLDVAAAIEKLRGTVDARDGRSQDPYCLRCVPQVHAASWAALDHHAAAVDDELAAVIDNPLTFPETGRVSHCGHFHGQALAMAADSLALGLINLANIAQARLSLLLRGTRTLPRMLVSQPGARCGLMMLETTGGALVARMRAMGAPLSVHNIAASSDQEDHTSMAWEAVRRTETLAPMLAAVLAAEAIAAAQALQLRGARSPQPPLRDLLAALELTGRMTADRPLGPDIERLRATLQRDAPPVPR